MTPNSSTLAWKILWTEEPGRLQSWGQEELDTTERLHFHFSLSCIGEGNGNPLQCSCLENPRDWGAWWAAVYGVVQSRTRLKRLSSSSSSRVGSLVVQGLGVSAPTPKAQGLISSFAWLYIVFSTGQVILSALSWCSASTSVSEGVFLMYPWREIYSTQNLRDAAKAVLRGKFIAI